MLLMAIYLVARRSKIRGDAIKLAGRSKCSHDHEYALLRCGWPTKLVVQCSIRIDAGVTSTGRG